jgi:hypothetical protein
MNVLKKCSFEMFTKASEELDKLRDAAMTRDMAKLNLSVLVHDYKRLVSEFPDAATDGMELMAKYLERIEAEDRVIAKSILEKKGE